MSDPDNIGFMIEPGESGIDPHWFESVAPFADDTETWLHVLTLNTRAPEIAAEIVRESRR